jgi:hypothetical protein
MLLTVDRVILEELFKHAASAAHLVGHLDDGVPDAVVGALADDVDAIAHGLGELLGDPRLVVGHAAIVDPADRVSRGAAPLLMAESGGAR